MNFFLEWAFALHRAVWFPLNWALGLERPGVALAEFAYEPEAPAPANRASGCERRRRPAARPRRTPVPLP
jgi:hypothetical protein